MQDAEDEKKHTVVFSKTSRGIFENVQCFFKNVQCFFQNNGMFFSITIDEMEKVKNEFAILTYLKGAASKFTILTQPLS